MVDLATMRILKFWISNVPNLHHAWLDIDDTAILAHCSTPGDDTPDNAGRFEVPLDSWSALGLNRCRTFHCYFRLYAFGSRRTRPALEVDQIEPHSKKFPEPSRHCHSSHRTQKHVLCILLFSLDA